MYNSNINKLYLTSQQQTFTRYNNEVITMYAIYTAVNNTQIHYSTTIHTSTHQHNRRDTNHQFFVRMAEHKNNPTYYSSTPQLECRLFSNRSPISPHHRVTAAGSQNACVCVTETDHQIVVIF